MDGQRGKDRGRRKGGERESQREMEDLGNKNALIPDASCPVALLYLPQHLYIK